MDPRFSRASFWPIAIPLAIGVVFLIGAAVVVAPTIAFLTRAKVANAAYVGSVAHSGGSHGGTFLYPRFRFRLSPGGSAVTITSTSGSTDQSYADGDTVRVRYDPAYPEHAVIVSFWTLWAGPVFLAVLGLGFIAPGLTVLIARKKQR